MLVKTLQLPFRNQSGKDVNILLASPKEGITKAETLIVMNLIVAKNLFSSSGGDLITALDPVVLTRDTTVLA